MFKFPKTEKGIRSKISSFQSAFKKEKKKYGDISDGSGNRYVLFCLYFVLDDLKESEDYFAWYENEFSDDVGEPIQKLCWALSLLRMGKAGEAKYRLADLMLSNLYLIPFILGQKVEKNDMWHASSDQDMSYVKYLPEEVRANIKQSEIDWMKTLYDSSEFRRIRKRYIEIFHKLQNIKEIKARTVLLDESRSLLNKLFAESG